MVSKDKNAKKKSSIAGTIFVLVVIYFFARGMNLSEEKEFDPVPPSVPTDVGTLPPGLDK